MDKGTRPGAILRDARLRAGWTQLQLAAEADVTERTIRRWERVGVPYLQLVGLLALMGPPPDWRPTRRWR